MSTNTPAARIAETVAAALALVIWTAGRNQVAPEGTRVVKRTGGGGTLLVITAAGEVVTGLDRGAITVPDHLVEGYMLAMVDSHRSPQQRRDLVAALARRANG